LFCCGAEIGTDSPGWGTGFDVLAGTVAGGGASVVVVACTVVDVVDVEVVEVEDVVEVVGGMVGSVDWANAVAGTPSPSRSPTADALHHRFMIRPLARPRCV